MNKSFLLICFLCFSSVLWGQSVPAPGDAQEKEIYIVGGTIHVGNGVVVEEGTIVFKDGRISSVKNEVVQKENSKKVEVIDATGKHIYPGFITPNSVNGLEEVSALRQTIDHRETGSYNPNVRALIAYNTDSWVTPTVRTNGILTAQVRPTGGRISGTSSIVQLDAWNWEDAAIVENDGLFLSYPSSVRRGGWWGEPGGINNNDNYDDQVRDLEAFFKDAQAYCQGNNETANLKFESMCEVFSGTKKVYMQAAHSKDILGAVDFAKDFNLDIVVVGGRDAWLVADILRENKIPVILSKTHTLPFRAEDDVDLPYKMPFLLKEAGVEFCMQAAWGSGEQRNLPFTAAKAAAYGLTKEEALMSITSSTAKILGIDDKLGTLEEGKLATLFISTGDALDPMTSNLEYAFIEGRKVNLENKQKELYRKFMGKYDKEFKQH